MADSYFAVQIKKHETTHDIAKAVLEMSKAQALKLSKLDMLGELLLGVQTYVKFRVDSSELVSVLEALRQQQSRNVIWEQGGVFQAVLADGRKSEVSLSKMLTIPNGVEQRTYRGTGLAHWREQFSLPN